MSNISFGDMFELSCEPLYDVEDLISSLLKSDWATEVDILNIDKEFEALSGMGGTMTVEDKKCEKSKDKKCEKKQGCGGWI